MDHLIHTFFTECNCHEHATECTFNPYVYIANGNRTGGVCINCMHNTDGTYCNECKQGFYQYPGLDLTDPNICARTFSHSTTFIQLIFE